jgi:hypothetical protein
MENDTDRLELTDEERRGAVKVLEDMVRHYGRPLSLFPDVATAARMELEKYR